FRLGFLVNFLSHPVLSGFTSAAAVIIGASQIRNLTGLELDRTGGQLETLCQLMVSLDEIHLATTLIGIGSILVMILVRKWRSSFPSALLAVAAGIAVTSFFQLQAAGVSIVGDVPGGLPRPDAGFFNLEDLQSLIPLVLVISLVSYMESIAVAKAIANRRGYRVDPDQELIALGGANIGGAFFQSFPTTGGFSRTAVNDQSGAQTTVASVITVLLIGFTVLFLTPLFTYLPQAVLAAIILVAVAGLFDAAAMAHLWNTDRRDLAMLLATFFATLILGIEEGILTGVALSLAMVIYSSARPHNAELGRLGNSSTFRNIDRYDEAAVEEDVLIFRFDSALYFANVEHFRECLAERIRRRGDALKLVILDGSSMPAIDSTGMETLEELISDLNEKQVGLYLAGVLGPVRDKLKMCGVIDTLGSDHFFFDVAEALEQYRKVGEGKRERPFSPLQTNL
ncbi:MAG: SulP family inorganic anion transporter, partial [Balneolaceae bacterium]